MDNSEISAAVLQEKFNSDNDDDKDEAISRLMKQVGLLEKLTNNLLNDPRLSNNDIQSPLTENGMHNRSFHKSETSDLHTMSFLRTGDQVFLRYEGNQTTFYLFIWSCLC